jgi:hypothetical protein
MSKTCYGVMEDFLIIVCVKWLDGLDGVDELDGVDGLFGMKESLKNVEVRRENVEGRGEKYYRKREKMA